MAAWTEEMLVGLSPEPWQPLSVRTRSREPLPLRTLAENLATRA